MQINMTSRHDYKHTLNMRDRNEILMRRPVIRKGLLRPDYSITTAYMNQSVVPYGPVYYVEI